MRPLRPLPTWIALAWVLLGLLPVSHAAGEGPPHIVLVLLDDVGIEQLSVYDDQNLYEDSSGYPYAHTPVLEQLAADGVRFNQARANPVCSPTRASLLSGQYSFRHQIGSILRPNLLSASAREFNIAPAPVTTTLPQALREAGYESWALGKWHLAVEEAQGGTMGYGFPSTTYDFHPTRVVGFDRYCGSPRNFSSLPNLPVIMGWDPGYYYYWWTKDRLRTASLGTYNTLQIRTAADGFADAALETPLFLFFSFHACHTPLNGSNWAPKFLGTDEQHGFSLADPSPSGEVQVNTGLRACLETLDTQLGVFLAGLPQEVRDRTLIVVMGDNGTEGEALNSQPSEVRYPIGHPLHLAGDETELLSTAPYDALRMKGSLFEGGIHVPLIVSGPMVVEPGRTSDELIDVIDLYATFAELAGAPLPAGAAEHSRSFVSLLQDPTAEGSRDFSFAEKFRPIGAPEDRSAQTRSYIRRDGDKLWKLIHDQTGLQSPQPTNRVVLYELTSDPLEQVNLTPLHPAFAATWDAYQGLVGDD